MRYILNIDHAAKYSFILLVILLPMVGFAQTPLESFRTSEAFQTAKVEEVVSFDSAYIIRISSSDELTQLNARIRDAIKNGRKNIEVRIGPGVYYYDQAPVYLYNIDAPDVCISIKGSQSKMVANGHNYSNGAQIITPDINHVYLNSAGKQIALFEDIIQTDTQVEVVDKNTKLCRIKNYNQIPYCDGMKLQLSEWYLCPTYDVVKIENGFIYFTAHDLEYNAARKCYNVNYDYGVSSLYPRYRLWNPAKIKKIVNHIHACEATSFLCLYRVNFKSFSISDLVFLGSAQGANKDLFYFRSVKSNAIIVKDCCFDSIGGIVVRATITDNLVFNDNEVRNCMYGGVYTSMDCSNSIVTNNTFYRLGNGWTNSTAVSCYGRDFYIANNKFEDVGYSSIKVGAHFNWTNEKVSRGVIEHNHIWFGDEYYNNCYKYTLIDSGAIYVATMNERVIVRYNYIHNYKGVSSYRAIYCDEGAMNVTIYGNVIRDIPSGHAILSWRATKVNEIIPESNGGIEVYYNVIWGNYKFDERSRSSCIQGKNLILFDGTNGVPKNVLTNFAYQEEEAVYSGARIRGNRIHLPRKAMKELKRFPTYNIIKKWVR